MPPFFNRLTSLASDEEYPYNVPMYPRPMYPGGALSVLGRGQVPSTDYINQDVMGINGRLSQNQPDNQSPLMNQYLDYLKNYPRPEQFQPGKLDRLTAALAGFSAGAQNPVTGVALARDILDRPYEQAKELYQLRAKPLELGAQLESTAAYRERNAQLREEETQRKREADQEKARHDKAIEESRDASIKLRELIADDKNNIPIYQPGGNVQILNKRTNQRRDSGIPTGKLTDEDKMWTNYQVQSGLIWEREAAGEKLEGAKQGNRVALKKWMFDHPHLIPIKTPGGDIIGYNPSTNETEDTGTESGTISQEDLQNLIKERQIAVNAAKGSGGTITTTTKTKEGGVLGFGATPTTTVTKKPINAPSSTPVTTDVEYRQRAINELNAQKKVVNEQTITAVIAKLKALEGKK